MPLLAGRRGAIPPSLCGGMMRALILAAGRGSRMGHLGDDRPKCLVELEGKPLIERQIAALRRGGVDEIGVVRGYRAEMIDLSRPLLFRQPAMGRNQHGDVARRGRPVAALGAGHRQLCRHLLPQRVGARSGRCPGPVGHQLRPGLASPMDHGVSPIPCPMPKPSGSMPRANCWRSAARRRGSKTSRGNIWAC